MELTVDEALKQGIAAHKAGKLKTAERFYRAILSSQPAHPDANHNLGVISVSVNKAEEAVPLFRNAVNTNPEIEQFWLSYIDALIRSGDHGLAAQVLTNAQQAGFSSPRLLAFEKQLRSNLSTIDSRGPQGLKSQLKDDCRELSLAMDLREAGKYKEAQEWLYKFAQKRADNPEALSLLSQVLLLDGKEGEAEQILKDAASINPDLPSIYRNQARLLLKQSRNAEAFEKAKLGCDKSPKDLESLMVLAACLGALKRDLEASEIIEKILAAKPNYAEAYANRALIRLRAKDIVGAIADAKKTVRLKPHLAKIWQLLASLHYQSGNLSGAIEALRDASKIEPSNPSLLIQLGDFLRQKNNAGEAIEVLERATELAPTDPNAWTNLGASFQQQKRIADAKKAYEKALSFNPNSAPILSNLGVMAKDAKEWDSALAYFDRALELKPNLAEAHVNLGVTFKELGRLSEAEACYQKATALKPDFAEAHYSLGNTLKELGKLEEALASYAKALTLKPDLAEAHNNLGSALQQLGRYEEAETRYREAIALNPSFAGAHSNLGTTLKHLGRLDEALASFVNELALEPECADTYANLGNLIKVVRFSSQNRELYPILTQLLIGGNHVRPKYLAEGVLSLLKHDPLIEEWLLEKEFDLNLGEAISLVERLDQLPLLHHLMRLSPLPDLKFERLFVVLRKTLLVNLHKIKISPELINFLSTLALHNFINEYIFSESDEETCLVESLAAQVIQASTKSKQPDLIVVLCLASYRPLYKYSWCDQLEVLDNLPELKARLIEDPLVEKEIAEEISAIGEISNSVSIKVRQQYEENPYPRWIKLGIPTNRKSIATVCDELNLRYSLEPIKKITAPAVLVAGCGTGQNAIEIASRFSNSDVTAIDLSIASLAYAQRKTRELSFSHLEYLQADVLHLNELGKEFDIIECTGVLHHMEEPMAGWRTLTNILKPGGLMKIGLYSELARQHILKVRQEITSLGVGTSEPEIRRFRQFLVNSDKEDHARITRLGDFYSLSMLRDLIFHVNEHQFTLIEIKSALDELGLSFCGLEMNNIGSTFKELHGPESDIHDLALWHQFEQTNPHAFMGMYQFWCQKL